LVRGGQLGPALEELDEAIAIVDRGRSFFYTPELHRMRGQVLLEAGAERRKEGISEIERALHLAGQQECPIFALRAARDVAALDAGRWKEKLRAIAQGFQQGLDSVDLREARELLA